MSFARVRGPGQPDQACDLVAASLVEEYLKRDLNARLNLRVSGGYGALRLGASGLGSFTQLLTTSERNELVVLGSARFYRGQVEESASGFSLDLGVLLGVQYDVSESFQVGASIRSPSLHATGNFDSTSDLTSLDSDATPLVSTIEIKGNVVRGFPFKLAIGGQYKGDGFAVALDG